MNALANDQVAEYLNEHFVATYLKVGTFQKVNGQKVGGNVASYFCLYDGSVLHAVPGPVGSGPFLTEARWAVETRRSALTFSTQLATGRVNMDRYKRLVRQAHTERYFADGLPLRTSQRPDVQPLPASLPRDATQQAQVHWLLASEPLASIDRVYPTVWEEVLNERLSGLPVLGAE